MVRNISLGALAIFEFVFLKVDRNRDVRNSTIGKSSSAGEINDVFYMSRAHHALVVNRNVHEELIEGDVLLRDRKSTRLNSSHVSISYAVFCLKKKYQNTTVEDCFSWTGPSVVSILCAWLSRVRSTLA